MILDLEDLNNKQTRDYNLLLIENSKEYTGYVDKLSRENNGNIYWWISHIASRDIWVSTVPEKLAKLLLVKKYYDADNAVTIKTCDECLARALLSFIPHENIVYNKIKKRKVSNGIKNYLRLVKKQYQMKRVVDNLEDNKSWKDHKNIIVLYTDIFPWNFNNLRCELRDFLKFDNYIDVKNIYIFPEYQVKCDDDINIFFENINGCQNYNFILKERFLSKYDYVDLFFLPFKMLLFCRQKYEYKDIDISALVYDDFIKSAYSSLTILGFLEYKAMQNMKKAGVNIQRLIGWYEGQPSSIGLFMGYGRNYPNGSSMGYVAYPIDETCYSVAPSKEQIRQKVVPEEYGIMGQVFLSIVQSFDSDVKVKLVPSFKMQPPQDVYSKTVRIANKKVLVALPYYEKEAQYVINFLNEAYSYIVENEIEIMFKNHPVLKEYTLSKYKVLEPKFRYKFVEGVMADIVVNVDYVITSQSGSAYENILYGVPVIAIAQPAQICHCCVPQVLKEKYTLVYSVDEMIEKMDAYSNLQRSFEESNDFFAVKASKASVNRIFVE